MHKGHTEGPLILKIYLLSSIYKTSLRSSVLYYAFCVYALQNHRNGYVCLLLKRNELSACSPFLGRCSLMQSDNQKPPR